VKQESRVRSAGRVLVVEDEAYVRESLLAMLSARGFEVSGASSLKEAESRLRSSPLDVVLSDLRMPGGDGLELVRRFHELAPELPVVILTGHGTVPSAVECLKAGASDYILKPADPEALEVALRRALDTRSLRRELRYLRSDMTRDADSPIGESPAWRKVLGMVDAAAPSDSTVLLSGESGTGKELLARRLHVLSQRSHGPFVRVNCATVPIEMWESEFFGHRKGAFPTATSDREGRFQLADRGTLLLDEVSAIAPAAQAKLLRAVQDGEFERLGETQPTRVDVRIVAATNANLDEEVRQGRFRSDLFYRLNVLRIDVPPLRDRRGDVPLLTQRFVEEIGARLGRPTPKVSSDALARLAAYPWPGNVRELRSVIERALVLDPVNGLEGVDLLPIGIATPAQGSPGQSDLNLRTALTRLECELLTEALKRTRGVRKEAAQLLGIDPRNLSYYLKKHGLEPSSGE
jgi:DNA-binding NtrC family response regulator